MDTSTTIRFCDLIIGLVNFVEFLAFALPIAGLLTCGLIVTSRYVDQRLNNAGHALARKPSRIRDTRSPRIPVPTRRRQPKSDAALIITA